MVKPCPQCLVLRERVAELEVAKAALQAENATLKSQLDEAQRAAKRQAAPFSKGQPKEQPKKRGRKSGEQHGRHGHRQPPEHIDETYESALARSVSRLRRPHQ